MDSMLELARKELESHDALTPSTNDPINRIMAAIPFPTVPDRMKATIAATQLVAFASQFKRNLKLWNDTLVPVNAISFVITGSGGGKDSSVNAARKCFTKGYDLIDLTRKNAAIAQAKKAAMDAEEDLPNEFATYKNYLKPVPPIDISPTTGPGLIQHINDISDLDLSAGFLYAGEFSDELAFNPDMTENIKVLSETFDLGEKHAKYTKSAEHRSKAISGEPVSALFVGSPGHIFYDESVKRKFNIAFMSKLARRSWFCYTPERIPEPIFDSVREMILHNADIENKSKQARQAMQDDVYRIAQYGIETANQDILISDDVYYLFETYKRYNNDYVDSIPNQESTYALIRRHLQWKALKLAGAFAIYDMSDTVESQHYIDAIRFCELLDKDMELFEHDLNKSAHERFSDYVRTLIDSDGKVAINVHDIKKLGFLSTVSKIKLQELVTLCAAYDKHGIYSVVNDGGAIQYELIITTSTISVSYKPIDCAPLNAATTPVDIARAKKSIAVSTSDGFFTADTTFADLTKLLSGDYAYSPFKFRDGIRSKNNIIPGTKWLVLDIDDSAISAEDAHFMLSDINHHIALSSDPTNQYKFRVLLELDSVVDLDAVAWKHFYLSVAHDLAFKPDPLPQSQIFFSYAGRPIYSFTDGETICTRDYIMQARETAERKAQSKPNLSPSQIKALLDDPISTFDFLFHASEGEGSRSMIRAARYAIELGCHEEQVKDILREANDYWYAPMEEQRFESILNQVSRMF